MVSSLRTLALFNFLVVTLANTVIAQKKDSTWSGSISGAVKDTGLNYFLPSATVSVYRASDSSLVLYSMTNSRGEFRLTGLPTGVKLTVRCTYIGYTGLIRSIILAGLNDHLDLGELHLQKASGKIEDTVVVTPPPVQMHGDTLEFNAAAFSLDKNAVADDLLRKLPGVIVWGDGSITVNGRPINKLLVDGKPFFGGETAIATQNIPKNAIEKVQVYQEYIDPNNPLDSITSINLKLRRGKRSGYFGDYSAGAGSQSRYDVGTTNNIFGPRDQLGVVAQSNNVNKLANDLYTILKNNTFKGVAARVEYQPDLNIQGSNHQSSGGLIFSHDLIPDYNQYKQDRVSVNSFVNHNENNTTRSIRTISSIGIDSSLTQQDNSTANSVSTVRDLETKYNFRSQEDSLLVKGRYGDKDIETKNTAQMQTYLQEGSPLSSDTEFDSSRSRSHAFSLTTDYDHHGFSNSETHQLTNWSLSYAITLGSDHINRNLRSALINDSAFAMDRFYDRKYDNNASTTAQTLNAQLGDFSSWLFGQQRILSRFHILVGSDLKINTINENNLISDRDTLLNLYFDNPYLTKKSQYVSLTESPHLAIGRTFSNVLANRYQKDFTLNVDLKEQFFYGHNTSSHVFQEFTSNYAGFLPTLGIGYTNFQYGEYYDQFNLTFQRYEEYPTPDQRFPLVDSSNVYLIREGNPALQPMKRNEVSFHFRHYSYRSKNTFSYGASLTGGIFSQGFADSVIIDLTGRYAYYTVNISGRRYARFGFFVNKSFLYGPHQIQLLLRSSNEFDRNPTYLGYQTTGSSGLNVSNNLSLSDTLSIFYTYKQLFALDILQNILIYRSGQEGFSNGNFNNTKTATTFGLGVNINKRVQVNSNATYYWSVFSNTPANKYTIWNAFVAYRFLPGNNLELKFSALDLLNENKGIVNNGNNYAFSHGTVNMLHQYFMATVTFFPRNFGKSASAR